MLQNRSKSLLQALDGRVLDGEYQNFKSKDGAFGAEHFRKLPRLKGWSPNMSDQEIWYLNRGGHDPQKVYAAYASPSRIRAHPP